MLYSNVLQSTLSLYSKADDPWFDLTVEHTHTIQTVRKAMVAESQSWAEPKHLKDSIADNVKGILSLQNMTNLFASYFHDEGAVYY